MIDYRKARYIISAPSPSKAPKDGKPSILFIGRSNVGKSTLINSLTGQKIAYSSKKAGKTKLLNYFLIDDSFYLVDAPGYGSTIYANLSTINFAKMMEEYAKDNFLRGIVLLLDLRHPLGEDDKKFLSYLQSLGKPLIYVVTKADLLNQSELSKAKRLAGEYGIPEAIYSKGDKASLDSLKGKIAKLVGK
ncbi:MAG: ribosome biogenesis GTP-binding protein YihA/YsxC [Bacillota bacterium]|nr:ribosome biogenesis GTP-binding protein YihA/YsxC [Bacillota bacterium]